MGIGVGRDRIGKGWEGMGRDGDRVKGLDWGWIKHFRFHHVSIRNDFLGQPA